MKHFKFKVFSIIFVVFILLLSLFFLVSNFENKIKDSNNIINALNDTLIHYKDNNNNKMAKIKVLETQNTKIFTKLNLTNTILKELQNVVKENQKFLKNNGSATIIHTKTEIITKTKTKIDTIDKYPVYIGNINNKWYSIQSVANKDSTAYRFNIYSKLNLIIGQEKQGLFKKSIPYAIVNDENPYTDITDMRVYQVKLPKKKHLGIGIYTGYGITIIQNEVKTGPQLGAGLIYKF